MASPFASGIKKRWPITLWFANCPGTDGKFRKKDVVELIASGLFPELEEEFPQLAHHYNRQKKP